MAQVLSQVMGHENQRLKLRQAVQTGRLFPTQILAGPESVGKSLIAKGMVQFLLCDTQSGCGQCASCLKVSSGQHESVLWIENQAGQTTQIKTEQAQAILAFLRLKSWNKRRCIVIDDAATLTLPAANTLLKSLEEPPEDTWFFLVTSSLYSVLSTIRSRSQTVCFQALTRSEMAAIVPEAPAWVLESSGGSVMRAQNLLDKDVQSLRVVAFEILVARLKGASAFCREKIAELHLTQEQALFLLRLWRQMVRDLSVLQSGAATAAVLIHEDMVRSVVVPVVRGHLDRVFRYLLQAEQDLLHHVDKNLIFENFALGRLDEGVL